MLVRLQRSLGRRSRGGMGAVLGGLDEVFHPGAARGRELLDRQHSMVMPMPSPGDKLLDDGLLLVTPPDDDAG